ncbi:MAG: G5 domain-containing protein [Chloroflexi bacterium]|nr:G5 domain-containing protein [Chloroflexota bacterium]
MPKRVVLLVDGQRLVFDTTAVTVKDVLNQQGVNVNDNDKIDPPLFAEVGRSATITVTRVEIKTEPVTQPIPFARQLVRDETYPQGQTRIVRLGANGTVAITYTVTYQDGTETSRRESARQIVEQPKDEILALGTQGSLLPISLSSGTIVYLANGNAWVMRHSSSDKRALTTTGDLDGRVLSLSPDGRYLLFTRAADENSLNTLWLIDTAVLGEAPRALSINDVLFAQLSPDSRSVAYSTGERTGGAPGWKAHNDLSIMPITITSSGVTSGEPKIVWKPSIPAPYSWWGTNFAWSPDSSVIAYALPNEIGWIESNAKSSGDNAPRRVLKRFAPFRTNADWVWVPQVAWSPDSRFIISTVHAPLGNPSVATDDPTFEVWALARDQSVSAALAKQTGMWAFPAWSLPDAQGESRVVFGVAIAPSNSEKSRYSLWVMDRDGGNKKQIFPKRDEDALVIAQAAWSPDSKQLIVVREGDLWLYDFATSKWSQLTDNGASALPRWAK